MPGFPLWSALLPLGAALASAWHVDDLPGTYTAMLVAEGETAPLDQRWLRVECDRHNFTVTIAWPQLSHRGFRQNMTGVAAWLDGRPLPVLTFAANEDSAVGQGPDVRAWFHRLAAGRRLAIGMHGRLDADQATFALNGIATIDRQLRQRGCPVPLTAPAGDPPSAPASGSR